MKNFARLLSLALVLVMALCLVGCGPKSKIKGEWENKELGITMEFDGKEVTTTIGGISSSEEYEFKGKKLYVDGDEVEYEFKDKDTLVIKGDEGLSMELTKK